MSLHPTHQEGLCYEGCCDGVLVLSLAASNLVIILQAGAMRRDYHS